MIVFDGKIQDAVNNGLAEQIIIADADGFVLDFAGYVYDPDELVSIFMSTQQQMQDGVIRFDFGQVSEFNFSLVGTETTVACRRVFWPDGGCMVIVVVPVGTAYSALIASVIKAYAKYLETQRVALRTGTRE